MKIIIDSREQNAFKFIGYPCETVVAKLDTGDYSIAGYEDKITIERKSVGDLCGCVTNGRDRFERELERMRTFESASVIVESPLNSISHGEYRSKLPPICFEQSILAFIVRYRCPFLFGRNAKHAEWLAFNVLRLYHNAKCLPREKIPYVEFRDISEKTNSSNCC